MNYFNFIIMKHIFIFVTLLLFTPLVLLAGNVQDTLTVVRISKQIIAKRDNPFERKKYINFVLNDGRVIVLKDVRKKSKTGEIPLVKGRIYKDGLIEGVFKTSLSSWRKICCGQKVVIHAHGRKYCCYLL